MGTRIQHRRDTAANWTTNNPILASGEVGWESDTNRFKIGDGTNSWTILKYFGVSDVFSLAGSGHAVMSNTVSTLSISVINFKFYKLQIGMILAAPSGFTPPDLWLRMNFNGTLGNATTYYCTADAYQTILSYGPTTGIGIYRIKQRGLVDPIQYTQLATCFEVFQMGSISVPSTGNFQTQCFIPTPSSALGSAVNDNDIHLGGYWGDGSTNQISTFLFTFYPSRTSNTPYIANDFLTLYVNIYGSNLT